ncbi:MAG: methyltransferase domain-containing protein [Caulobacter sp.]|nr:methyltransferase domain-containing protein [Caulobacter sp.]
MSLSVLSPDAVCSERMAARRVIEAFENGAEIDDATLDRVLGLRIAAVEGRLDTLALLDRYGVQRFDQGDLTYEVVRAFHHALAPEIHSRPDLRLLDLGCGYGRFGLYGAILHNLTAHGLELVAERADEARRAAAGLGLERVTFESGDMLQAVWPAADVYCLMNSVLPDLLPPVVERLRAEALARRIVIASVSTSNRAFADADWLRPLPVTAEGVAGRELRIWESV